MEPSWHAPQRTRTRSSTRSWAERLLLFGFTEFVDDEDVFAELVAALEARARRIGAARAFGPVNLLPNQSGGVVTSGFDERGFVDSPYNHAYYPGLYERHGFERRFEGETFVLSHLDRDTTPLEELFPFDEQRIERERLEIRHANRRRMKQELVFVRRMLNESFAQLRYFTEIDEAELAYQVAGLGFLIDERIALYLFKAGEPIAFILCVPDTSSFVRRVNGDLDALNQARLLLTRGRYRSEAIGVIQGTIPSEQGKGYLRLLTRELMRNLRAAGYHTLRGTFIEHRERRLLGVHGPVGPARARGHVLRSRRHVSDLRDVRRLEPQFFRAPSAHNTQPWLLEYRPDRVELRFDPARALPAGDPTRRDLLLSLGALAEAVLIAASAADIALEFEPAFDLESRRVGIFATCPHALCHVVHARRPRAAADEPPPVRPRAIDERRRHRRP